MKYPIEYTVCAPCACGVANDDWTHLDYYGSDDLMDRIYHNLSEFGYLAYVGSVDERSDFRCSICNQFEIDAPSVIFEGEDPNWRSLKAIEIKGRIPRFIECLERYEKTGNPYERTGKDVAAYIFETSSKDEQASEIARLRSLVGKLENQLTQLTLND